MVRLLCCSLFAVFGHRICRGRIPEWAARGGEQGGTCDVAPLNLYNVIWRVQSRVWSWIA